MYRGGLWDLLYLIIFVILLVFLIRVLAGAL